MQETSPEQHSLTLFTLLPMYNYFFPESEKVGLKLNIHQPRLDAWDKCSDLVHWENLEGMGGECGGRGDWDGEHM